MDSTALVELGRRKFCPMIASRVDQVEEE